MGILERAAFTNDMPTQKEFEEAEALVGSLTALPSKELKLVLRCIKYGRKVRGKIYTNQDASDRRERILKHQYKRSR